MCSAHTGSNTVPKLVHGGGSPKCVIEISVREVYIHCPKFLIHSKLWRNNTLANVHMIGDILIEVIEDVIGGKEYDMDFTNRAKTTLWS